MKHVELDLAADAAEFIEKDGKRSLGKMPSSDLQDGCTFVPRRECQLAHCTLCFTVSKDVREDIRLQFQIGPEYRESIDVSYVSAGQRIRIPLQPAATVLLNKYDVHMQTDAAFWIMLQHESYPYLGPCIASSQEPNVYLDRICDSAVVQFGWMQGCMLDAQCDLYQKTQEQRYLDALHRNLNCYLVEDGINFESPQNEVLINEYHSIELTLPNAVINKIHGEHPAIDHAIAFWRDRRNEDGLIFDGASITAEGCYTIAYPLMQVGVQQQKQELVDWSLQQLAIRREALFFNESDGPAIYLRNYHGAKGFKHWARGVCWYFLGHVRTLLSSNGPLSDEQKQQLQEITDYVMQHQNAQGLWYNFFDQHDKPIDSSGSAGIACALALASQQQWIDASYRDAAEKALRALTQHHLVDGGFVNTVAPNNKRGEEQQRGSRRTCEPLALGLLGQLHAALI